MSTYSDEMPEASSHVSEHETEELEEPEAYDSQKENDENPLEEPTNLSDEALARYRAERERAGVIYISRIPPGMSPAKVRHIMSAYGEVGRIYLQQEDAKRAYLRKKFTGTKKPQYTEGWVEFKDKKIAKSVAEMLNAQPIGGKKGSRWRDDVWTMKYLHRFKWYMLTEQIAHEQATHSARLRVELSQSKIEQKHYLKQVEIGKSLEKRAEKKRKRAEIDGTAQNEPETSTTKSKPVDSDKQSFKKRRHTDKPHAVSRKPADIQDVLGQIF